ncbi:MAG: tetratricopeptide repeat protein [Acidobacteriia bacterium]|nr:tetratricopeptide repeat protein [Terriglobia bacterium]
MPTGSSALSYLEEVPVYKILVALALLALLAYANSLRGEFVFDDTKQILNNPSLRGALVWSKAFTTDVWAFQRGLSTDIPPPYYRPFFTLWLDLGYRLFQLAGPGWHLLSILLHAGVVLLVFFTVLEFTGHRALAALTAALFAVHPVHSESVAWISAVPDLLVAVFFLPALWLYQRARRTGSWGSRLGSWVCFAASTLCKENALSLPLILAGWELWHPRDGERAASLGKRVTIVIRENGPYFVIAGLYLWARYEVLGLITWHHPFNQGVTGFISLITIPRALLAYLWHFIFPFHLSLFYDVYFVRSLFTFAFWGPLLLLLIALGLAWISWKRIDLETRTRLRPHLILAALLAIGPMLPILNLKAFHEEYLVQDRYLYLPSVGLCLLLALFLLRGVAALVRESRRTAVFGGVLFLLLIGTIVQNQVWADSVALWTRAEQSRPNAWSAHYNRGLALMNHQRYVEAESEFTTAAGLNPQKAVIFNNLALAEAQLSKYDAAGADFRRAIGLDSNLIEAYVNQGALEYRLGHSWNAEDDFKKALSLDPRSTAALYNLARMDMDFSRWDSARERWEKLLNIDAADAEARWRLGSTLKMLGQSEEARRQWQRALHDARGDALRRKILADLKQ